MKARRLLIVSNRLPITVGIEGDQITFSQASGGLATGLRGCHERMGGLWIGWPGSTPGLSKTQRAELDHQLEERRIVALYLTRQEIREYYEEFSNGVLWPIFHYLLDRVPTGPTAWDSYHLVNERFAELVAENYRPGDMIWVHDYQLLLVPGMLRQLLPKRVLASSCTYPFPLFEEKAASISWHYRRSARGFGKMQARQLRVRLSQALVGRPVDIVEGKKVLEVLPRGANNGVVVQRPLSQEPPPMLIAAFGDDRADELLFAALPPTAVTLHVGPGASFAQYRLRDSRATREFLAGLLE